MKGIIWQPLVLGVVMGLLAGMSTATRLSFLTSDITDNAIGFFFALMLLAAALGGPVASAISTILFMTIAAFWGPDNLKEVLSDPITFWSNMLALAAILALIGILYLLIFERFRMPARLLPWAGIVVAFYLVNPPIIIGLQFYIRDESGFLTAVSAAYRDYFPQAIFDIIFTSLVYIALPARYRKPLWYGSNKVPGQNG